MSKLDETNKLIDDILVLAQSEGPALHHETVEESLLIDIAKSLAIIADKMNKED